MLTGRTRPLHVRAGDGSGVRPAGGPASTGALLTVALLSGGEDVRDELARWTRRVGLDLRLPLQVALLHCTPPGPASSTTTPADHVRGLLAPTTRGAPLVADVDGLVAAVHPAAAVGVVATHWRDVRERLLAAGADDVTVAIGAGGLWPAGVRTSLRQARHLASLQREGSALGVMPPVSVFGTSGLAGTLIGAAGGGELLAFAHRVLEPLLGTARCGGELLETLHAYLACAGSVGMTARRLHLHPSSVKYRVKVIRELVGAARLDDPDARFELELAVRLVVAQRETQAAPLLAAG